MVCRGQGKPCPGQGNLCRHPGKGILLQVNTCRLQTNLCLLQMSSCLSQINPVLLQAGDSLLQINSSLHQNTFARVAGTLVMMQVNGILLQIRASARLDGCAALSPIPSRFSHRLTLSRRGAAVRGFNPGRPGAANGLKPTAPSPTLPRCAGEGAPARPAGSLFVLPFRGQGSDQNFPPSIFVGEYPGTGPLAPRVGRAVANGRAI